MRKFFLGARKRPRQVVYLPARDFPTQIEKICHALRVRRRHTVLLAKTLENRITIVGVSLLRIQRTYETHQSLQIYVNRAYNEMIKNEQQ